MHKKSSKTKTRVFNKRRDEKKNRIQKEMETRVAKQKKKKRKKNSNKILQQLSMPTSKTTSK